MKVATARPEPKWFQIARSMREDLGSSAKQIAEYVGRHVTSVESFFSRDGSYSPSVDDTMSDAQFITPHVYRTIRKIDMGPIATAAKAAVASRQKERIEAALAMWPTEDELMEWLAS